MTVLERDGDTLVFAGHGLTARRVWQTGRDLGGPGLSDPESDAWMKPPSGWREQVEDFIRRALLECHADWDGMGADAPTVAAAESILRIVKQLPPTLEPLPEVLVTSDGGFCLEWADADGVALTIEAQPDGTIDKAVRGIDY